MNSRWIIPDGVALIKDNWRTAEDSNSPWVNDDGSPAAWVGRCVLYEQWAGASEEDDAEVNEVTDLLGDLVFQDIQERNTSEDLTGKPLVAG